MSAPTVERPGPANSVTNDEGMRWYIFGEGDTAERYVSVTTALGLVDKEGLRRWATALSADAAFDELPKIIKASRTKDCGNTWKRCSHDFRQHCATCPCRECHACVRRWVANRHYGESSRRADEGTRIHDVAEHWTLNGGEIRPHEDDIAPYITQWQQWVTDYGLTPNSWEMAEATVISREYAYAGTLDGILIVHADATELAAQLVAKVLSLPLSQVTGRTVRLVCDFKSREKEEAKLYPEHALQQSAYRNAEVVRLRDGREFPLPATDGAVIVQVRPDGYLCQPVVTDEMTYAAFLAVLAFARWHFDRATKSVSSLSFKVPKDPKPEPAPKPARAVAKRTPAKKTTPRKTIAKDPDTLPDAETALRPLRAVAADQSATLASMRRVRSDPKPVHPDSPFGDSIPF